jgi:SagB-type dehydrogenase family enzyme
MKAHARPESAEAISQEWYVAEGKRGQQLLDNGQVNQATEIFEAILTRLGDAPTYGRAVILGRLGRCFFKTGRPDLAVQHVREAIGVIGRLAPSDGVKGLRGTLRSELGDALRAGGHYADARKAYEAALKIAEELKDLRGQGIELAHLGALELTEGNLEQALTRHQAARRLFQQLREPDMEAAAWHQLGRVYHKQQQSNEAERHYREAARINEERGHLDAAAQTWNDLADLLQNQPDRLAEARQLTGKARDYREVQRHAPVLFATLDRLGESPSLGKAVILGQLGRCFRMAGRPDVAVAYLHEAIGITATLSPSDELKALRDTLEADPAEVSQDVPREASALRDETLPFEVTIYEDLMTDYVFEPDLLVDGPRKRRIVRWTEEADPPPDGARPMLLPCARTWMDDEAVHFSLPPAEPIVERHPGCTVVRRSRRELSVMGNPSVLWRLISKMDGARTVAEILARLPEDARPLAARMLGVLAATGAIDVSGRPVGRFLHLATKKGVLPAGGLEGDAVLRLATDGNYREYPGAPRIAISPSVPDRLRTFHELTRSRRSSRDYRGFDLERTDFDALLHTACGLTGTMPWAGREVKLRAYPSSGALYAVEIYPVVFRVEGMQPGIYHYRAVENVLEVVRPAIDPATVVDAALPVEREIVLGAAALFCLTGCFPRHEQKYGQGGYRMLVAEAGHISQNLILAATALGLSARPFGGVFDDLLNHELGLDGADEQFLLAVLVGHTGES